MLGNKKPNLDMTAEIAMYWYVIFFVPVEFIAARHSGQQKRYKWSSSNTTVCLRHESRTFFVLAFRLHASERCVFVCRFVPVRVRVCLRA